MSLRVPSQPALISSGRVLVWFSCGVASACAAKITIEKYPDAEVLNCANTLANEHPDNLRFIADCERWFGRKIKPLLSEKYADIFEVFDKTGWLVGPGGARCTAELKRAVREEYQQVGDVHVIGLCADEQNRIADFERDNPEIYLEWILRDAGLTKRDCVAMVNSAEIELPMMYKLGYKNNNCIGCVKGGMGYWNKIRADFPLQFERMVQQERKMNVRVFKDFWLSELPVGVGRYKSDFDIQCGVACSPSHAA